MKSIAPVTCCIKDYFSVSGIRYECGERVRCTDFSQRNVLGLLLTKRFVLTFFSSSGFCFGFYFCCDSHFGFWMGCPYIPLPLLSSQQTNQKNVRIHSYTHVLSIFLNLENDQQNILDQIAPLIFCSSRTNFELTKRY